MEKSLSNSFNENSLFYQKNQFVFLYQKRYHVKFVLIIKGSEIEGDFWFSYCSDTKILKYLLCQQKSAGHCELIWLIMGFHVNMITLIPVMDLIY